MCSLSFCFESGMLAKVLRNAVKAYVAGIILLETSHSYGRGVPVDESGLPGRDCACSCLDSPFRQGDGDPNPEP